MPINALDAAKLCKLAYSSDNIDFKSLGFDRGHVVTTLGSYLKCLVCVKDNKATIVFRGTDNLANWLLDSEIELVPFNNYNCLVHKGFLRGYQELASHLLKMPTCQIDLILGHSLGGAFANLLAFETKVPCLTFGCPRVGNRKFAHDFPTAHFRYVHYLDIVPRLPLAFHGYHHTFENLNYIDHENKIWNRKPLIHEIRDLIYPHWPGSFIVDHCIVDYVDALSNKKVW